MTEKTNSWANPIPRFLEELDSLERKELLQRRILTLLLVILSCIVLFFIALEEDTISGDISLPANKMHKRITNESPKANPTKAVTVDINLDDAGQAMPFNSKPELRNFGYKEKTNQSKPLPKKKSPPQKKITFELTP